MSKKVIAAVLALSLVFAALAGCRKSEDEETTTAAEETTAETTSETSSEETDAEDSTDEAETEADGPVFDAEYYSAGLEDNGFFKDVRALDYITLPDYSGLVFQKEDLMPSDEQVQTEIDSILELFPIEVTDRAIEDGDLVNIDYVGKMDGVEFENGSAEDQQVTAGSNEFIDDFLTQIIGHKPGETMDVEVTFPDPYTNNPDFSGKDAVFTVTLNYIYETPELTEDWVTENSDVMDAYFGEGVVKTPEDLENSIRDYFYESNLNDAAYAWIQDNVETPEEIPENALLNARNGFELMLSNNYGMTLDSYLELGVTDEETVNESIRSDASMYLLYQAVAESEGWDDITEEDYAEVTGTDDNSGLIDYYGRGYIAKYVLDNRAVDFIMSQVQVEE